MNIWETLSAIDCGAHTEKKGGFTYLSWTWAWAMVKERYPSALYRLEPDITFPDQTMEVRVSVTIEDMTHEMWLPVLDHRNKAIANPNAFDINSSRMRCLVKCLAMFGLGHYIYAGESMPDTGPAFTSEQKEEYLRLMADGDGWGMKAFGGEVGGEVMSALFSDAPKGQVTKQKEMCRAMVSEANESLKASLAAIEQLAYAEAGPEGSSICELIDEMGEIEKGFVMRGLDEATQLIVSRALGGA